MEAAREERFYLEVSAFTRRLSILLPHRQEVFAALGATMPEGDPPPRPLLKVFIEGDAMHLAVSSVGAVAPAEAVDVAPEAARAEWVELVAALQAFGTPRISGRTRYLARPRGTIDVHYESRSPDEDVRFADALEAVAARLDVAPSQRTLWRSLHASQGGVAVMVTTAAAESGPARELAIGYARTDWDDAVALCKRVADADAAREGARVLGTLAGILDAERMDAVTLALRPEGIDVVVLVTLR